MVDALPAMEDSLNASPEGVPTEEDDDDLLFIDINECEEFPDGPEPEDNDDEDMDAGKDAADDEDEGIEVEDMAALVLPNGGAVLCCAISPADPTVVCTGNQADHAVLFRVSDTS